MATRTARPHASQSPPNLGTPAEVARVVRKSVKTLANWRSRGIGPKPTKVGHTVLYDWREVNAWLRANTRP